jgi:hypothetical protein
LPSESADTGFKRTLLRQENRWRRWYSLAVVQDETARCRTKPMVMENRAGEVYVEQGGTLGGKSSVASQTEGFDTTVRPTDDIKSRKPMTAPWSCSPSTTPT